MCARVMPAISIKPAARQPLGLRDVADALRMQHRHFDDGLDTGCQIDKRLGRQRHRRHAVGERVVRIGARADDADKIDEAGFGHCLRDFFGGVVIEAVVVELIGAHAHADAEIAANGVAHGCQHFDAKAHAVFKTAAPLIGAHVGARRPELIDQLLMGCRNLDAVEARGFARAWLPREIANDAADIFDLNGFGIAAMHRLAHADLAKPDAATDRRQRPSGGPCGSPGS